MSQASFMGSLSFSSQNVKFTRREIYEALVNNEPRIFPKDTDYTSHVRQYVLTKLNIPEDKLSSVQLTELIEDSRAFTDSIRKEWSRKLCKSKER